MHGDDLSSRLRGAASTLSREDMLNTLELRTQAAQHELADRVDAGPELLIYLASNGAQSVRRAVAANLGTPAEANMLLAEDVDDEVRAELALKIGRLMPDLPTEENAKLRALTIETMEKLAQDQLPRVRAILAEEIKRLESVPRRIIGQLARDTELIVAAPILEYSPLLSDADLLEIIASAKATEALAVIARRKYLSVNVCDALVTSLDIPAVAALLTNPDAQIREEALAAIIEQAEQVREWHKPLVLRVELSQRAIRRIASFVGMTLVEQLASRHGLEKETREVLNRRLRQRIESDDQRQSEEALAHDAVEAAVAAGRLDDGFVDLAAEGGKREVVVVALAFLAQVPRETVRSILQFGSAKPLTALVWRANLSMRVAFRIQRFVMKLPPEALLPAREGVGYPLSDDEMRWHLSYFDIRG